MKNKNNKTVNTIMGIVLFLLLMAIGELSGQVNELKDKLTEMESKSLDSNNIDLGMLEAMEAFYSEYNSVVEIMDNNVLIYNQRIEDHEARVSDLEYRMGVVVSYLTN